MTSLHAQRVHAAEYSGGVSSNDVYQLALCLGQDLKWGNDLLEFGAGRGLFVSKLLESGYRGSITCADLLPCPASVPTNIRWIETDLNDALPLPDQSFDTITCLEVIAHLENPRFIFREFARLLRPGGNLILTTPNQESIRALFGLIMGGHFSAFRGIAYPALITALLREDFRRICNESGLCPPQFHYTNSGIVPKLHVSWQNLSLGLLKGRLFSDNVGMVISKIED